MPPGFICRPSAPILLNNKLSLSITSNPCNSNSSFRMLKNAIWERRFLAFMARSVVTISSLSSPGAFAYMSHVLACRMMTSLLQTPTLLTTSFILVPPLALFSTCRLSLHSFISSRRFTWESPTIVTFSCFLSFSLALYDFVFCSAGSDLAFFLLKKFHLPWSCS